MAMKPVLERVSETQVLDGGSSTELASTYGHQDIDDDPLWSARLLKTHPDVIKTMHTSFLEAGSDIIETVTYQASVNGFMKHLSLSHAEACQLIKKGAQLTIQSRDEFWEKKSRDSSCNQSERPLVAGSIGPYGAHLADASEYHGNYIDDLTEDVVHEYFTPIIQSLVDGGVDLLAFDTIPSAKEAKAICAVLEKTAPGFPAWISFSCQDGERVGHGETLKECVTSTLNCEQVFGVGINCTAPRFVSSLLRSIPDYVKIKKTVIVYPNSGEYWSSDKKWCEKEGEDMLKLSDCVGEWLSLGAKWIGGCCRVSPANIREIRQVISSWK